MKAGIIAIGEELTTGRTLDSNSAWLSQRLLDLGIVTEFHWAVGDVQTDIVRSIREAADRVELILVTGGLGPTADDLTRQSLAEVLGESLIVDEEAMAHLRRSYENRGIPLKPNSALQAMRPPSATLLRNPLGTAPGLQITIPSSRTGALLLAMPGVPREMKRMWDEAAASSVRSLCGRRDVPVTVNASIHCYGLAESRIGDLISEFMARDANPNVGTQVQEGITSVRIRAWGHESDAKERMRRVVDEVGRKLSPYVFGHDNETLAGNVVELLRGKGLMLASAESCTGGWLGKMITDVAGASDVYLGGFQTYSNAMKVRYLGVRAALIEESGAVSADCAEAMAFGALDRTGADLAVAITGVAGPAGGSIEKPVGTVFVAVARSDEEDGEVQTLVRRMLIPGDREQIRMRAAMAGVGMVYFMLARQGEMPALLWEVAG